MSDRLEELYLSAIDKLERWDLEGAEADLQGVLAEEPEHYEALNKMGVVYARRDQVDQAEQYFNQVLAIEPSHSAAYSNLGNIYAQRDWTDRAIAAYEKSLALDPDYPTALHNLGVLYKKTGNISKGVELLKKAGRQERGRARAEMRSSPQAQKSLKFFWLIVAGLILLGYLFFRS